MKAEHGLDLIVIDYLQLMRGRCQPENRQQEISEISRSLKALAKELNVPVVALSQLSRAVETRGEGLPQLSDLRESGALEQDADVIMFLTGPEARTPWSRGGDDGRGRSSASSATGPPGSSRSSSSRSTRASKISPRRPGASGSDLAHVTGDRW